MKKKAFTLVEIMVVITILIILSSIWFLSYTYNITNSKDINRISQVINIWDWIYLKLAKWIEILPEDSIEILDNWKLYSKQWFAWKSIIWKIWYFSSWLDPDVEEYFTYALWTNNVNYEIIAFLKDDNNLPYIHSGAIYDYLGRVPYLYWKNNIWIIVDDSLVPLNKYMSWTINIDCVTDLWYKMIFENGELLDKLLWQSQFKKGPCYQEPIVWCKTQPNYTNATFTIWNPITPNQDWIKWDITESCSYQCINGFTWLFCENIPF